MVYHKIILIFLAFLIFACSKGTANKIVTTINPEIGGVWSDSMGCNMKLDIRENHLILVYFEDLHHHYYQNLDLKVYKESILTKFSSSNPKFSGAFSEGLVMVDNKLCSEVLHKLNNS